MSQLWRRNNFDLWTKLIPETFSSNQAGNICFLLDCH